MQIPHLHLLQGAAWSLELLLFAMMWLPSTANGEKGVQAKGRKEFLEFLPDKVPSQTPTGA